MSRRTIVRRPQRRAVFVPMWLRRIRMANELMAFALDAYRRAGGT